MGPYEIYFGSDTAPIGRLKALQTIFKNASIESYLVDTIETVWEKFIFISALASTTSYLNQNRRNHKW
jgi:2-dehydropantoate 2-reductase